MEETGIYYFSIYTILENLVKHLPGIILQEVRIGSHIFWAQMNLLMVFPVICKTLYAMYMNAFWAFPCGPLLFAKHLNNILLSGHLCIKRSWKKP